MTCPVTDSKCDQILAAASGLFERYGYSKTTIDEIAAAAGIGKGSVYLHFGSKEELGLAWLSKVHGSLKTDMEERVQPFIESNEPLEALRAWLIHRVVLRRDIFDSYRQSLEEALAALKTQVAERKAVFFAHEVERVSELIQEAVDKGLAVSPDPKQDAESMLLATNSLLPLSNTNNIDPREVMQRRIEALASLLIRSISSPSS